MSGIQTFVTEYTADLIYSFQSAYDQTFQIKFQRNTKLEIFVQRVEVCLKRSCGCSSGICNQHRSFYLHESLSVKVFTDRADDFRTFDKCIFYFRVHDQIHISLTITHIGIGQTMEFLRKNLQTLGKKLHCRCMNRDLTGLGFKHFAFQTYDITDIHFFESFVFFFSNTVSCNIRLDVSL